MIRITNNRHAIAGAMLMLTLLGGCKKEYSHKRLGDASREFARVEQMLQDIRQATGDALAGVLTEQMTAGMDDQQQKYLSSSLERLASAEKVELLKVDRFGQDICRATFKLTDSGKARRVSILLTADGDGKLRWLKPN